MSPVELQTIFIITQLQHELVAYFGILFEIEAGLLYATGEAEVRKRWSDDMESWRLVSIALQER